MVRGAVVCLAWPTKLIMHKSLEQIFLIVYTQFDIHSNMPHSGHCLCLDIKIDIASTHSSHDACDCEFPLIRFYVTPCR